LKALRRVGLMNLNLTVYRRLQLNRQTAWGGSSCLGPTSQILFELGL